jgi:hypothetical protein
VYFSGIQNRTPAVCGDCSSWNRAEGFDLEQDASDPCQWDTASDLPCNGTWVVLAITPDFPAAGDMTIEIGMFENGNFMGDYRTVLVGTDEVDCTSLFVGGWVQSANPPDECDFDPGSALISFDCTYEDD